MSSLKDKLREYANRAQQLGKKTAKIGVLGGNYETAANTPVAYVAAIQEYGAPGRGIPARPFMRPTVQAYKQQWSDSMHDGLRQVIRGQLQPVNVLDAVGELAASEMKLTMSQVQTPPLSPVTVMLRGMKHHDATLQVSGRVVGEAARRVAEGKTNYGASDKPLEDTFTLYDSIAYEVSE